MCKKLYILIIVIIQMLNLEIYSSIEKVTYRGWSNCYLIRNGTIDVIITPETGGRILKYSLNKINVLFEDKKQNGRSYSEYLQEEFDPDGGRFDYGPEFKTSQLHSLTWMGEWNVNVIDDFTIILTSQLDYKLGVQTVREFTLEKNSSLSIKQTMLNISNDTTSWFFWGRTLVPIGGKMLIPTNPKSNYPQSWGKWSWGLPQGEFHTQNISDSLINKNKEIILFEPTNRSPRGKYGTDSKDGWIAFGLKDVLFVKCFDYFPNGRYRELAGQTISFFSNGNFSEMEPISPQVSLAPGESFTFQENWWLFNYKTSDIQLEQLKSVSEFIKSNTTFVN